MSKILVHIDPNKTMGYEGYVTLFEDRAAVDEWRRHHKHAEVRSYPVRGTYKPPPIPSLFRRYWIYFDTNKDVVDTDYLKVFVSGEAADAWLAKHDPEGVAFAYDMPVTTVFKPA